MDFLWAMVYSKLNFHNNNGDLYEFAFIWYRFYDCIHGDYWDFVRDYGGNRLWSGFVCDWGDCSWSGAKSADFIGGYQKDW